MYLSSMYLQNFRNYKDNMVQFSPGLNVIHGDNAQGKTNLLEAAYFLATGRSHRTSRDSEMIREGSRALLVKAWVIRKTGQMELEIGLGSDSRKKLKINGVSERKIARLVGAMATVLFSPDDLQLLKGPPLGRRRFLDIEISQISQTYLFHLISYNKVIAHRNALLRADSVDRKLLSVYDEQLLHDGAQLVSRRAQAISRLWPIAARYHALLSENQEELRMEYQTQGAEPEHVPDVAEVRERLWAQLQHRRGEELRRQVSLVGPHRDDIAFWINGRDARLYASQGQQRTTVLSLKLAELQFMTAELGESPLLLLDDVASELDPHRRNYLLQAVDSGVQTFLSCTDLRDLVVSDWPAEHRILKIISGHVEESTRRLV